MPIVTILSLQILIIVLQIKNNQDAEKTPILIQSKFYVSNVYNIVLAAITIYTVTYALANSIWHPTINNAFSAQRAVELALIVAIAIIVLLAIL